MKSLRARLSLAFVVVALGPAVALGFITARNVEARARADYETRLARSVEASARRIDERAQAMSATLARLCEHDLMVDRVLLEVARDTPPGRVEALVERQLPPLMLSVGFDVLLIVRAARAGPERGRVLGAGHYPALAGARVLPLLHQLDQRGTGPFVTRLRLPGRDPGDDGAAGARRGQGPTDVDAWVTGCMVERDGVSLALIGGRELSDERVSAWLGADSSVEYALVAPGREPPARLRAGGGLERVYSFYPAGGGDAFELVAAIDDAALDAQLRELTAGYALTVALAGLIAVLIAAGLALRLSRPLRELEDAATRIGEGDLEGEIATEARGEVGRTFGAFNRMTRELKTARRRLRRAERIAAWRDIARRIAHEIKNPLSPIQMSIETMRKTYAKKHPDFDEIFEESTLTILEEVERMKHIVTEFSEFARLPAPQLDDVEIASVLEHVAALVSTDQVELALELPSLPTLRADREQLVQVFLNLRQNAGEAAQARHGGSGAKVSIVARAIDAAIEVVVSDNGPGIPPERRDEVFEPYFTTKSTGTGLGLSIVQRIVEDHGGGIEIAAGLEGGAAFVVRLPIEGPPLAADGTIRSGSTFTDLTRPH